MRKLITILLALLLVTNVFSQDHLTFKNIPITGTMSQFSSKLKSNGFTILEQDTNYSVIMSGSFAGFDDCLISFLCTKVSKTVWQVIVFLPAQSSWSSVRSRYDELKEKYIEKYGEPSSTYEFFQDPYELGDGYELQAIKLEKGYYATFFNNDLGAISVQVKALDLSNGYVMLIYEDAKGVALKNLEDDQIISNDI